MKTLRLGNKIGIKIFYSIKHINLAIVEGFVVSGVDVDYPGLGVNRPAPGGGPQQA